MDPKPSPVPQEFSEISAKGLGFTARSRSPPSFEARLRPGWAHHVPEPQISGRSAAPGIATDPHRSPRSSPPTRSARDRTVDRRAGQSSRPRPPRPFRPKRKDGPCSEASRVPCTRCPGGCIYARPQEGPTLRIVVMSKPATPHWRHPYPVGGQRRRRPVSLASPAPPARPGHHPPAATCKAFPGPVS
jgi:hypothetical protein